jgi:hypothetical protein
MALGDFPRRCAPEVTGAAIPVAANVTSRSIEQPPPPPPPPPPTPPTPPTPSSPPPDSYDWLSTRFLAISDTDLHFASVCFLQMRD